MYYAGIDLHRKTSYISVVDEKGKQIAKRNLSSKLSEVLTFLGDLKDMPKIVIESSSAWYWLYDGLVEQGYEVVVSNPKKTKAIASAKIKNDKLDAHMLAQLLRVDLVATVYVSDQETRGLKELLRHRARLVRDTTRMKNRIHNLLAKNNLRPPVGGLFTKKGLEFVAQIELPPHHQGPLHNYLWHYQLLKESIEPLDKKVREKAKDNPQAQLLMSLPGVGPVVALTLLAEIGDISRFPSPRRLASYAGLVPSLDSSGGKDRLGSITKQGSPWMRWALVESAQAVARMKKARLNIYFRKRLVRAGYKKAIVATAHRLLTFAFYVLRNQRPYQEQLKSTA